MDAQKQSLNANAPKKMTNTANRIIKWLLGYAFFFMGAYGYALAQNDQPVDKQIASAESTIREFQNALKAELMRAIANGGPESAIGICHEKAPEIVIDVSQDTNINLRRTSLRWRNPANAPDEWEAEILTRFEEQKRQGAKMENLTALKQTPEGLRFMRAIPTQGVCMTCHGDTIAHKITRKIKEYYPDDKAIDFKNGDIRGAFSILIKEPDK